MTPHRYTAYGLEIASNVALPGLSNSVPGRAVDIRLHLGTLPSELADAPESKQSPFYRSSDVNPEGVPELIISRACGDRFLHILCHDGTELVVTSEGDAAWATWPPGLTLEDTATYLLGSILGLMLRLRGLTCLHASAVEIQGMAVILVGTSGAGKSSTAAAFARSGFPVLADDIVVLLERTDGVIEVPPANPRLRLHEQSVEALFGSSDALPQITEHWSKRYLDLSQPGYRFPRQPLPLGAAYLLSPDAAGPMIDSVSSRDALMELVPETFAARVISPAMRAREFRDLGRMLEAVPVRRARATGGLAAINDFCKAIAADFRALRQPLTA